MISLTPVYLEWQDAYAGKDWLTKDQADCIIESEMIIRQVGFVYYEDEKCIVLISKVSDCDQNIEPEYGSVHRIPKTWIKKRIDLTEKIKE